ncbi:2447_t:CDS:2 [Diversispora eburnea]|uniref:2447_t:CDS:1 n=1 Tax=Diversispora eburnea TaxID=1213867 RepID=A0A9N9A2V7_9GLOM|nr:2447_t:CDS:2 [Diversispora eburnea]
MSITSLKNPCKNLFIPANNQKRFAHDLIIRQRTHKPIVKFGAGGRSSVSGHVATVFGCTGFLGRYVVSKLAKHGTQVVVPYRDEDEKRHLKVNGDLGQVVPLEFDLRNEKNIHECIRNSDIVYNLIGRDYETKYVVVHVEGAARIARISREDGVARFVHVSSLNADKNSKSKFYRSKAYGEEAVRAEFPDATIVRPSVMHGAEDRFLNRLAGTTFEYVLNGGQTKCNPVHVNDVAAALETILSDESTIGETYELYGPREYTHEQIFNLVDNIVGSRRTQIYIPKMIAMIVAKLMHLPFISSYSPDDVERAHIDDKITPSFIDKEQKIKNTAVKTFEDLGILPKNLESTALSVLRYYRRSTFYDEPIDKHVGKVRRGVYYTE